MDTNCLLVFIVFCPGSLLIRVAERQPKACSNGAELEKCWENSITPIRISWKPYEGQDQHLKKVDISI